MIKQAEQLQAVLSCQKYYQVTGDPVDTNTSVYSFQKERNADFHGS